MSKQFLNTLTGEFVESKQVQPVTIVQAEQVKFRTNYTDNCVTNDAEHNSGEYIVDDSEYIDFKALLQRSAQCTKRPTIDKLIDKISSQVGGIDVVNSANGFTESEVDDITSEELSTSETFGPQEAEKVSNPVDNSTDVASEAETNSN